MKYHEVDSDTSIGQNVNKDWKEQEALNLVDMIEQKMNGGIKPMKDQFPGEQEGEDPADIFESDMITKNKRMNKMEELSFSEKVEKKMAKLSRETYRGWILNVEPKGGRKNAFQGNASSPIGGGLSNFHTDEKAAMDDLKKKIDAEIKRMPENYKGF